MTKRQQPNFYITVDNYYQLTGAGFWEINDVPPQRWKQIKDHFGDENTMAVFASGSSPTIITQENNKAIGGIDWVKIERNPKDKEPPLNVYHYVIGKPDNIGYPVYGPYRKGQLAPHHSELEDLGPYLNNE